MLIACGGASFAISVLAFIVGGIALYLGLPSGEEDPETTRNFQMGMTVAMTCACVVIPMFNMGILLICAGVILRTYFCENAPPAGSKPKRSDEDATGKTPLRDA